MSGCPAIGSELVRPRSNRGMLSAGEPRDCRKLEPSHIIDREVYWGYNPKRHNRGEVPDRNRGGASRRHIPWRLGTLEDVWDEGAWGRDRR